MVESPSDESMHRAAELSAFCVLKFRQALESMMVVQSVYIAPVAALIAGVLILVQPQLLNLVVAIYLIAIGILGIAPHLMR